MRKTNLIIVAALALTACAPTPFPAIQSKLGDLKGQPVKTVVEKLGDPDEQIQKGDGTTYAWYRVNKSGSEFKEDLFECAIRVYVDKDDKITGFFYSGSNAGCGRYAHMLDDSFEPSHNILGF